MKTWTALIASVALATAGAAFAQDDSAYGPIPAGELPSDSLYLYDATMIDQHGRAVPWTLGRGRPVLVSMFYSACPAACPMLISSIKQLEKKLSKEARDRLVVVLISMDPARDDPAANLRLAKTHGVDLSRWHFLQPKPEAVPEIAALLGMTYRQNANGSYAHSMEVTALRPDGSVAAVRKNTVDDPEPILRALEAL